MAGHRYFPTGLPGRRARGALIVALLAACPGACGSDPRVEEARDLAARFRQAVVDLDIDGAVSLMTWPVKVRYHGQLRTFPDRASVLRFMAENVKDLSQRLRPRTGMEIVSERRLLAGEAIWGRSRSPEEAAAYCRDLGVPEGGFVARLHETDREGSYVILSPDEHGRLAVTGYHEHR